MDAFEHRAHPRSPVWLHAVIQPESESSGQGGLVLDFSLGGAAIEMGGWPGDRTGMLGLLGEGLRYLIPFVVVGVEQTMRGVLIHVKFDRIDERCEAFLAEILESAEADFEDTQRFLASRPND